MYDRIMLISEPGWRSRYSDYAMGWTVRGSNPGVGRDFPHMPIPTLGSTHPPVK